ncbi:MAG TPA: hypothetical protein VMT04_10310 [Terriglobales bacterium]|nr:hypothetical protein [Terriglobales bacterium]
MSPDDFFKKDITQISAGKKIGRGERSLIRQRRNSSSLKKKINGDSKSSEKDRVQAKDSEIRGEKEQHIDVII